MANTIGILTTAQPAIVHVSENAEPFQAGHVVVVKGCMFSGKSTEFQRRITRARIAGKVVKVFRPAADARSPSGKVESRDLGTMDATEIDTLDEIADLVDRSVDMIAIDECQFLPDIADFCTRMSVQGYDVLVCGLDYTFEGKPFGGPKFGNILNVVPDEQVHLKAVCVLCGNDAIFTQHIGVPPIAGVKDVGGADKYRAVCRTCFYKHSSE